MSAALKITSDTSGLLVIKKGWDISLHLGFFNVDPDSSPKSAGMSQFGHFKDRPATNKKPDLPFRCGSQGCFRRCITKLKAVREAIGMIWRTMPSKLVIRIGARQLRDATGTFKANGGF